MNVKKMHTKMYHKSHHCELPPQVDEVKLLMRDFPLAQNFLVFFFKIRLVSEKYIRNINCNLSSYEDINWERKRMMVLFPHSIHPYSALRVWWDVLMLLAIYLQFLIVPLEEGILDLLKVDDRQVLSKICITLDIIIYFDCIMNFFTGYYDTEELEFVLDLKKIAKQYLWESFFVDLLGNTPLWILGHRLPGYWYLLLICKAFRYQAFARYLHKLLEVFKFSFVSSIAIKNGFLFQIFMHCTMAVHAHVWLYKHIEHKYENHTVSTFHILAECLYHAATVINFSSLGYVANLNLLGKALITITWVVSFFIQVRVLAGWIEILAIQNSARRKYTELVNSLKSHAYYRELPKSLKKRLLEHYEFHFEENYFNTNQIFENLSHTLQQQFLIENCRQLVRNVRFLEDIPVDLVLRIALVMYPEDYLAGETIVQAGTMGTSMFFIFTGRVAVFMPNGEEVCHLEDGDYFGEVALLSDSSIRVATVTAIDNCKLYRLDKNDFLIAIKPHPDKLKEIEQVAEERVHTLENLRRLSTE